MVGIVGFMGSWLSPSVCRERMSKSKSQWAPEHEDTAYTKLLQKARESPFVPVGE